ncbi:MAG TPA: alpha/beta hydrolase fold domain-containing protein [Terracidiphilus sp.]|nr:alpha/beta hydrolase fold domain-containing protein [Terracidiphilus sp.]
MRAISRFSALPFVFAAATLAAQQTAPRPTTAAEAPTRDTSYIDADGAAHVTRVVSLPETVSPQARAMLARPMPDAEPAESLAERRARNQEYQAHARVGWNKICPNQTVESRMAGVPVHIITPENLSEANRDKVLINIHGGGFNADSGSYIESIPIAYYTRIKVVSVLYRLAPEHPFPAGVDDVIAVYKALLNTYKPDHIAIYGTSAGAIMTGEVAVKLKQLGLPLPAALGVFSGMGDFARNGDSSSIFSLHGLSGTLTPPSLPHDSYYVGSADPRDPVLSPVYADLHGLPPTLFVTATRDMLLSGTVNLERAYLEAGVDAHLVVFDALPHAFWYNPNLPESIEASHIMANFFVKHLGK